MYFILYVSLYLTVKTKYEMKHIIQSIRKLYQYSHVDRMTTRLKFKSLSRAGEMAQMVKVLATKADNLSSILRTHMVEGENYSCKLFFDLPRYTMVPHTPAHIDTRSESM